MGRVSKRVFKADSAGSFNRNAITFPLAPLFSGSLISLSVRLGISDYVYNYLLTL